jgi:HK97 family phage major capsid protein
MAGMGWHGAEAEYRSLLEGNATAGGVLVPTPIAADLIDMARAQTRVVIAGARTVPMESSTLKIGRQIGDPALAWHTEAGQIDESAMTFDAVTLKAKTLPCLVRASLEWLEDVDDAEDIIRRSIAGAMAVEMDRVALRGTGTDPEPRGVRNTTGVTVTSLGANGAAPTWDQLARAAGAVRAANFQPTAAIHHPRTETDLTLTKSTDGQYLQPPASLAGVTRLDTTTVPVDLTKGTAAGVASEGYVGAWSELLLGIRTDLQIRPLQERYLDTGEFGFFAYLRMDVQVAHPEAFVVLDGFTPAA